VTVKINLLLGDCVARMAEMPDGSVGSVVSDPPYGLRFMGKEFDDLGDGAAQREWHRPWLTEAFRILRPGGVVKAFGGTRTFHHLAATMRTVGFTDVGLEAWSYGSGFPKSLSVPSAIDKAARGTPQGSTKGDPKKRGKGALPSREVLAVGGSNGGAVTGLTDEYGPFVPETDAAQRWEGWGTALKPSWEPVVVGRKPLS